MSFDKKDDKSFSLNSSIYLRKFTTAATKSWSGPNISTWHKARYWVVLSKEAVISPKEHNRSYRHIDIFEYIRYAKKNRKLFQDVDLRDFYTLSVDKRKQKQLPVKRFYPRGFSIFVNESFVDESKWCCFNCKFFRKVQPKNNDSHYSLNSTNSRRRSTWVVEPDKVHSGPLYSTTAIQTIKEYMHLVTENSHRTPAGLSMTRRLFGFMPMKQNKFNRPFFTYFVTLLQFLLFFIIISTYGIAPIGVQYRQIKEEVLMPDLNLRSVHHFELPNMWIGPRLESMIHLGAKFAPCIKMDAGFKRLQVKYKGRLEKSGCCIFNDGSGCIQTQKQHCSPVTAKWEKNHVCGLDETHCQETQPKGAFWSKNKAEWPVCVQRLNETGLPKDADTHEHMHCQLVGRPCCIGVIGVCIMTTREYCNFKRGSFHQDAALCSHVSCMEHMCGMLPFLSSAQKPDQFYRFFTSLLIVPGILALVISTLFQFLIMSSLENLTGTLEMSLVYVGCGVVGSVFSSIFMPYYVEAGPSGSHYGVMAVFCVEVARWNIQESLNMQILIILITLLMLFFSGLVVPQIDNWAHLGGFVYGIFLAIIFRPVRKINYKPISSIYIKSQRLFGVVGAVAVPVLLFGIFYGMKESFRCDKCIYFNCLPFTADYCEGTSVSLDYNSMMQTLEEW